MLKITFFILTLLCLITACNKTLEKESKLSTPVSSNSINEADSILTKNTQYLIQGNDTILAININFHDNKSQMYSLASSSLYMTKWDSTLSNSSADSSYVSDTMHIPQPASNNRVEDHATNTKEEPDPLDLFIKQEGLLKTNFEGGTYYVVEGDRLLDRDALRNYMLRKLLEREVAKGKSPKPQYNPHAIMIGQTSTGKRIIWSKGNTIKYCISKRSFPGAQYDSIVSWLSRAGASWSKVCNIRFVYDGGHDGVHPSGDIPGAVDFVVRSVGEDVPYLANAFPPDGKTWEYKLKINPLFFNHHYSKVGMMRHELGHILGFLHEHIRPETPASCSILYDPEPFSRFPGMPDYDPHSVMHYPCEKNVTAEFNISERDAIAAVALFGKPQQ